MTNQQCEAAAIRLDGPLVLVKEDSIDDHVLFHPCPHFHSEPVPLEQVAQPHRHGVIDGISLPSPGIVLLMTEERDPISEAALEAVANLLTTARLHGIGVSFEPDAVGWTVGYMQGTGGGNLARAYDLETAVRAAERPLDELAARLSEARVARQG